MKDKKDIIVIDNSLQELNNNGYITNEELEKLKLFYYEDPKSIKEINEEISNFPINKSLLKEKLNQFQVKNIIQQSNNKQSNEPSLTLENITDFEKDGKNFIKIHYPFPDDRVRIIENRTDPFENAKKIFEELSSTYGYNVDGMKRAISIFEDILAKKCSEVNLQNYEDQKKYTEYDKLTKEEKERFVGLEEIIINNKKRFEGKIVRVCLEEELVIISTPNEPSKDQIKKIAFNSIKQRYELLPLDAKGYKYDSENNFDSDNLNKEEDLEESKLKDKNEEYEIQRNEDLKLKDKGISYKKKRIFKTRQRENN